MGEKIIEACHVCEAINGTVNISGRIVLRANYWELQHAMTPFGIGSLVLIPYRHCIHYWELNENEVSETGMLLKLASNTISQIMNPDQVYIVLWSHAEWKPGHIHFLLQPSWNSYREKYSNPGGIMQAEMWREGKYPEECEIENFCIEARKVIEQLKTSTQ